MDQKKIKKKKNVQYTLNLHFKLIGFARFIQRLIMGYSIPKFYQFINVLFVLVYFTAYQPRIVLNRNLIHFKCFIVIMNTYIFNDSLSSLFVAHFCL